MEIFNKACNEIIKTCFEQKSGSKFNIQKLVYHHIREKIWSINTISHTNYNKKNL
jgi:predicted transposase